MDVVEDTARSLLFQWAQLDIELSKNTTDWSSNGTEGRRNSVHRPVLFVCQSTGGLVVQRVRHRIPYDVTILTSHRLYYYLSQKVDILLLFEEYSEQYDLSIQSI